MYDVDKGKDDRGELSGPRIIDDLIDDSVEPPCFIQDHVQVCSSRIPGIDVFA